MSSLNRYCQALKQSMELLANDPRTIFLGQTVCYPGSRFTYKTLVDIPVEKRLEVPIMEEAQLGMAIGLSLAGYVPVAIYPRLDFLILAANQFANHLDRFEEMSRGTYTPKVIVRATIGTTKPYPGPQHCVDYTEALRLMVKNIDIVRLDSTATIVPAYEHAIAGLRSTLLIDVGDLHYAPDQ